MSIAKEELSSLTTNTTSSSSNNNNNASGNGDKCITDLEPRKMNEGATFDTEEDEDDDGDDDGNKLLENDNDDEAEYDDGSDDDVQQEDVAIDIMDQLVELFIERNGRSPNEEEVQQWIEVFQSLAIEDMTDGGIVCGNKAPQEEQEEEEEASNAPASAE